MRDFNDNEEMFNFIKEYLKANSDSIKYISYDSINNKIIISIKKRNKKKGIQLPEKIGTIDDLKDSNSFNGKTRFLKIVEFMITYRINLIQGDSLNVYINMLKYEPPCYTIRFDKNFNGDNASTKKRIDNFTNTIGFNWIYPIKDGWYIKGENCSSI